MRNILRIRRRGREPKPGPKHKMPNIKPAPIVVLRGIKPENKVVDGIRVITNGVIATLDLGKVFTNAKGKQINFTIPTNLKKQFQEKPFIQVQIAERDNTWYLIVRHSNSLLTLATYKLELSP
jgi:hypothetical protein